MKLFALALERVESKIHSSTTRQSAEILLSVSMNIHLQLQNAESKIQNEVWVVVLQLICLSRIELLVTHAF